MYVCAYIPIHIHMYVRAPSSDVATSWGLFKSFRSLGGAQLDPPSLLNAQLLAEIPTKKVEGLHSAK